MGKSSKKSTPKVDAAPAVVPPVKSGKKGKREAEEVIEKKSAKKQKIDVGLKEQAVKKQKSEVKAKKNKKAKKEETSSSEDDFSSESDQEQKVKMATSKSGIVAKRPAKESSSEESSDEEPAVKVSIPSKKQPIASAKNGTVAAPVTKVEQGSSSDSSSSSESDSDEDAPVAAAKNGPMKKNVESSDSSDSESDSDEDDKKSAKKASETVGRKGLAPVPKKKEESSDESSDDSDSDESSDEETNKSTKVTTQPQKLPADAVKNGSLVVPKKNESSESSESDSSSDDEDEHPPKVTSQPKKLPASAPKNSAPFVPKKKAESSDSSDESDSDEDEEEPVVKNASAAAPKKKVESSDSSSDSDSEEEKKKARLKKDDSDDEDESSEESDEEPQKKKKKVPLVASNAGKTSAKTIQKESSSEEESSDESSDDEPEKPSRTPKKNGTDIEMVDAVLPKSDTKLAGKKAPATPATPQTSGGKTLFVGNLSFSVERADIEDFFKDVGEIVDVRFSVNPEGMFKGFGHVEFDTAEAAQKALELNNEELLGRAVKLDMARERGSHTPYSGKESNSYQKGGQGQSQTVFVRGFDKSVGEDEVRSALEEHFGSCGQISRLSIPKDYETGDVKGFAYLDFQDADSFNKALELSGSELGGYSLMVDEARPKGDGRDSAGRGGRSGGRSGGRDGGQFGGRRGGGGRSGGRGGGRFGGRGRGSFNKPSAVPAGKKTTFDD
ncbi:nucleolin 2-like isoform X2 [Malania oleifera]|uniref:nucleolin 2-like isoform X2 n=1 Tax=Malania oleifera TaxID=397392 RepID=UPI0025AE8FD0|nr:nucleolin 2-like isoform X2 [Malania oleifera]